ncbi:MAG: peroxiredoxin [Candidatus Omnitrophica bacterium]|nr:peroxiredoxin [Candidatus Omnitrophota bacterium]
MAAGRCGTGGSRRPASFWKSIFKSERGNEVSGQPKAGERAPDFTLSDQEGKRHSLSEYKGRWVLLYFYPKDDTPGCTKEACGIRDQWKAFEKQKAQVFGLSADSVESHGKFSRKYKLPFTLLSDPDKKVLNAYGAWGRNSFLIDPQGKVAKVYEKVKPDLHAQEVLADLKAFAQALHV